MLHNLEMPTQIYHMAALGLSEFWKTAPQFECKLIRAGRLFQKFNQTFSTG